MWECKSFSELTLQQLHAIYKLRVAVFVVEQNCPYPEVDDDDLLALHLTKWVNGKPAAYARLIPQQDSIRLGRVLVDQEHRQKGYGRELLQQAISYCRKYYPGQDLHAQAQAYLEDFYHSFGFQPVSGIYLEDGIPHLDMIRSENSSQPLR